MGPLEAVPEVAVEVREVLLEGPQEADIHLRHKIIHLRHLNLSLNRPPHSLNPSPSIHRLVSQAVAETQIYLAGEMKEASELTPKTPEMQ